MSKGTFDYSRYIHPYQHDNGETLFAVGVWCDTGQNWTRPLDAETRRLTGCTHEYAKSLATFGGYTRAAARRRVRQLWPELFGKERP